MPPSPESGDDGRDIRGISIVEELKTSYLDYAMSVIVSRALPDVRDGLKPVHRRILYTAHENGYEWNKPYRKSARIVGDVMGKYHPHGDSSIYDALVRLAQDFSMRLPLIDGQGNFGSMDGDPPAAMRYTEARLAKVATRLLGDIEKETVDFQPNYDESETEPSVLPARFPNLLVNGGGGIAVGMATNIPPHNLGEVIDATCALIDEPEIDDLTLMGHVGGPDFPTGGIILGSSGFRAAYASGRGSVMIRSRTHVEEIRKDREAIIVTEIPYQVNKSRLVEQIAETVKLKKVDGIADLRDESDRDGVRVVIELKRDATADVVLNQLFRFTQLQTSFGMNMLALNGGKPEQMGLREILKAFIKFREQVITRRSKFELGKARDRAHILVGLVIAVTFVDEVVAIIRNAASPADAREKLLARHWDAAAVMDYLDLIESGANEVEDGKVRLSEEQVKAILDLRLNRLTQLGREEIGEELKKLAVTITELLEILRNRARLYEVLREELVEVKDEFNTPRRTEVIEGDFGQIDDESLIEREEMVVTVTHSGYIKRVPLSTYRAQRRGGKGRAGMSTREEDVLTQVFVTSTHTPVLFFSNLGQVYRMKVWRLPEGGPQARGKPLINLLPLQAGESISAILPLPEDEETWGDLNVVFATAKGNVRRNSMADFTNVPSNGKIAIRFEEGSDDKLIGVMLCTEDDDILLAARGGKCIRFPVSDVRVFKGRTSTGVRGMKLGIGDDVISLSILAGQRAKGVTAEDRTAYLKAAAWKSEPGEQTLSDEKQAEMAEAEEFILTVTSNGFGKRSSSYEYRTSGRGGQGITNIDTSIRNGHVVGSGRAAETDQIMLITNQGKLIRTSVAEIRIAGRATQGVTIFKVADGEQVVSVATIEETEEEHSEENQTNSDT
ncbi:MAG: DNA gyrase subunit A [Pseudomonadota bacterium]